LCRFSSSALVLITKSILFAGPVSVPYSVVTDICNYPLFLDGCERVEVLASAPIDKGDKKESRDGSELVTAKITVGFGGHTYEMTTRNQNQHLESVSMLMLSGPFESFKGEWLFTSYGAQGCQIDIDISYAVSGILGKAIKLVQGRIIDKTFSSFTKRFYWALSKK
jgi:ribosome-associated toxin RatA of RatAB toxin-antitoxin module